MFQLNVQQAYGGGVGTGIAPSSGGGSISSGGGAPSPGSPPAPRLKDDEAHRDSDGKLIKGDKFTLTRLR